MSGLVSTVIGARLLLLGLMLSLPATVAAVDYNFTTNNGTITITKYLGLGGSVTIPDTLAGLPVTTIGVWAFYNCSSLTSVTIPESVTSIGDYAFCFSENLALATIGNHVTTIGALAFYYCGNLTSVTIPDSVTSIGECAFLDCGNLTCVVIGNGVTSIGESAFESCSSLTNVMLGHSVTNLADYAFYNCIKLGRITIPGSVKSIGTQAFFNCTNLSTVTIGNSVTNIGAKAFANCIGLTAVCFRGSAPSLGLDVFLGANNVTCYFLPATAGWGATFSGRPAMRWNAQVQTSPAIFGMRTNQFGFIISGTTDIPLVVEACTNLAGTTWTPLQVCSLTNGSIYFRDLQWTNHPVCFYRLRWP